MRGVQRPRRRLLQQLRLVPGLVRGGLAGYVRVDDHADASGGGRADGGRRPGSGGRSEACADTDTGTRTRSGTGTGTGTGG
ncbi:hypothetical protein ACWDBD_22545 [Streptomyces sp. NPDC001118]